MFTVLRLWIDPMENRNAHGFEHIGFVKTKEEADRIAGLERLNRADNPWPLNYLSFPGCDEVSVPRFRIEESRDLSGLSLSDLKMVKKAGDL